MNKLGVLSSNIGWKLSRADKVDGNGNKKCFRNIYAPLGAKHTGLRRVVWPWSLNMWPENQQGSATNWGQPLHQVLYWSSEGVKRYWEDNTVGWEEWFDLDLWTCDLKINRNHLLIEGNPCTKFGIAQVKESKDIEQTTQWAEKTGLTLTF